jgi:hypothetical protein
MVPDERILRLAPPRNRGMINRQRVLALEANRYAFAAFSFRRRAKLLEHEGRAAELQPAPAELALIDPFLSHLEAEAVDVEAK